MEDFHERSRRSIALSCALTMFGCATQPTQEQTGMVIDGVLGGVLGSQVGEGTGRTVATVVGTMVGAMVGGSIRRSMDEQQDVEKGGDAPFYIPPVRGC